MNPPITSGRLHHVSFRIDDLDASLEFYRDILGCVEIPRPDMGFPGAWLQAGAVEVHLLQIDRSAERGQPPSEATPFANHVAWAVEDLRSLRDELERRGVEYYLHSEDLAQCWIQDPDGNVIEFIVPRS